MRCDVARDSGAFAAGTRLLFALLSIPFPVQ